MAEPLVGIIMGSTSDWETMRHAAETLDALGVAHETKVVSAHRTPQAALRLCPMRRKERGLKVIIAGAGGAAHLPGMAASMTSLPVLGVPVESKALKGMDSLLSIVQMPAGVPVGTLAIGKAGRGQRRACSPPRSWRRATRRWPGGSTPGAPAQTDVGRRNARMIVCRPAPPSASSAAASSAGCWRSPPPSSAIAATSSTRTSALRRRCRGRGSPAPRSTTSRRCAASPTRSTSSPTSSRICRSSRSRCSATSCGPARAVAGRRAGPRGRESASSKSAGARVAPWRDGRQPRRRRGGGRRARRCRSCSRPAATAMTARARPGSARRTRPTRRGTRSAASRRSPRPAIDFDAEFTVILARSADGDTRAFRLTAQRA